MTRGVDPVTTALIGYGFVGKTFHAPLITATPGFDLAMVASSDAAKVHLDLPEITVTASPIDVMANGDIELVVIATPNETHLPLARAALEAGKHVVVDKPFTVTLADARQLVAVAAACQRNLFVFHNRRWDSDFLGVKQVIKNGVLGRVTHFESHFDRFRPAVRDRWRERSGAGTGLWNDLGPHLIDQALQLFGLPDRVIASMAVQRDGAQVDDWAHVVLEFGSMRAILHCSVLVAGGSNRFAVHGETGSLLKRLPDQQEAQ
ncbi:MAG: oxidoreductase, partial [Oxalobacteraceae bacterium]